MPPRSNRRSPPPANNAALRTAATRGGLDEDEDENLLGAPPEADEEEEEQFDASDVEGLNDPDVTHLGEAPRVGGRSRVSDLFGEEADHAAGRATSPKLYAQAAQFPTCTQLRVWKWENGVPVGLGTIDSAATEEDFVRQFRSAMPRKGEGRATFKLRPIDIRGQELGQEVTSIIGEHHATLRAIREAEEDERNAGMGGPSMFMPPPPSGTDVGGEMSRMVEHMLATAEQRARALEESLEMERERMRQEELRRTQERVDLATNAAQGVQAITERMMKDEQQRADRSAAMQQQQSQLLITTLSSIFTQQQTMQQSAMESQRRADEARLEQERQRAERERQYAEEVRRRERDEYEHKRQQQIIELETKIRLEREEAERRLTREREELDRKERREREEAERRDRWFAEERSRREEREARESREREEARARREQLEREELREREAERQRQHELRVKEMEQQAQRDREHAERMAQLAQTNSSNDVLGNAAKMLGQFGIAPNEILPRLFGITGKDEGEDNDKPSPWLEALPKIVGVVSDVARASMQARAQQGPPRPPPPQPQQGPVAMLPPPYGDFNPPERPRRERERVFVSPPSAPAPAPASVENAPSGAPEGAPAPEGQVVEPTPVVVPTTPNLSEIAANKGVGLKAQKAARTALRHLIKALSAAPEEKWEEMISIAIGNELSIYHYANAVGVKAAMQENGASPELAQKVIIGMQTSALISSLAPDLNYGE